MVRLCCTKCLICLLDCTAQSASFKLARDERPEQYETDADQKETHLTGLNGELSWTEKESDETAMLGVR